MPATVLPLIDRQIRTAINERRLVELVYGRHRRIVEPHDYGVRRGVPKLLVYQVRGDSAGPVPGWRELDVPKIGDFLLLDETFPGGRGTEHDEHKSWDRVYMRVAPAGR
jgi:hypothetical protein